MKTLIILAVITGLLLWYALQGRDWLKSKSWAQGFFAWIEPYEIFLFKKSQTILFARLLSALGAILTFLTQFGQIDITPLMPLVPEKYAPAVQAAFNMLPLTITAVGWMVEKLRNATTKPIELVAVAEKDITPAVEKAIFAAEVTKAEAVAVVKDKAA